MRTVVDLQAVQAAWAQGPAANAPDAAHAALQAVVDWTHAHLDSHSPTFLLSDAWPDTVAPLRAALQPLLGPQALRLWRPLRQRAASAALRHACLAALDAEAVLVPLPVGMDAAPGDCILDEGPGALPQALATATDAEALQAALPHPIAPSFDAGALAARRPRLAFVSPMPPARSGISDYSAELLPALSRFYEIEVVAEPAVVDDAWVREHLPVRDVGWFAAHAHTFDRVLYQVGNSVFHEHMFGLLAAHPGTVVLHDFHLGHILSSMQHRGIGHQPWSRALHASHGLPAVAALGRADTREAALWDYPASLPVIEAAEGVIVHSRQATSLARQWYGEDATRRWAEMPLLRSPAAPDAGRRAQARAALGLDDDAFVVCSFGMTGAAKLNHRLLDAWLASPLGADLQARLFFVGANDAGPYGHALQHRADSGSEGRVAITGWVDMARYRLWLDAADAAVQLRTRSRGETSAAALDCLNHGLATVVNAHGSLAELPEDTVLRLPDEFTSRALAAALRRLQADPALRRRLGEAGRSHVARQHAPAACALACAQAIEDFHRRGAGNLGRAAAAVGRALGPLPTREAALTARDLDVSLPARGPRRLLVDLSAISRTDLHTGIQRVVRAILGQLLAEPPDGLRVEPVYLVPEEGRWHLRSAARYTLGMLGAPEVALDDDTLEPRAGDVYLGLDLAGSYVLGAESEGLYRDWAARGVAIHFAVYDLLPVSLPDCFPPEEVHNFRRWLDVVARHDGAFCISAAVAQDFMRWRAAEHPGAAPMCVGHFHLGADIGDSTPTRGFAPGHEDVLAALRARPSLLMVGTVEPRKGHAQALDAFERLWAQGTDANLVVVGKAGWHVEDLVARLRAHPEAGRRLVWLEGISDEYLEAVYARAAGLLAASRGEGFGLPLIEAAQHGLPIVARDLPVFREVAGEHAFWFDGETPEALADALREWLALRRAGTHPRSRGLRWLSWRESAAQLKGLLAQASQPRAAG